MLEWRALQQWCLLFNCMNLKSFYFNEFIMYPNMYPFVLVLAFYPVMYKMIRLTPGILLIP